MYLVFVIGTPCTWPYVSGLCNWHTMYMALCLAMWSSLCRVQFYNARDLDSFMDLMAEDVHVSDSESGAVIATNKHELRPRQVCWQL
jgi:hypothetical protein